MKRRYTFFQNEMVGIPRNSADFEALYIVNVTPCSNECILYVFFTVNIL
jgi:hypothetical protein